MKIQLASSSPFNLDLTICCGQVFRWQKHADWWYGVVGGEVLKTRQLGNCLEFENADIGLVKEYFGLRDNLPRISSQISRDEHIRMALRTFRGLRVIRQDPWECLISYICATYKSIAAIKHMLLNLSKNFGGEARLDGHDFHTFPPPEELARATTARLIRCGLGYRATYVLETARRVQQGSLDLEKLRKTKYLEAKAELLSLPGVGSKAADCISLFSLGKLEAFPVDIWVKRSVLRHYSDHFPSEFVKRISARRSLTDLEYNKLSKFGREYFGEYAGYAQEYLYHHERTQTRVVWQPAKKKLLK